MAGVTERSSFAFGGDSDRLATPSLAVHLRHIRTLLWLRWKLTVRGYTRDWRQIIGLVFVLLFLVGVGGVFAVGTGLGYILLPRADAARLLFVVLALLYVIWAILPLLQYTLNEGLDVTKLQTYPLTRGEQMVSLVLATFIDLSSIAILLAFAAVVVGWHATPLATAITLAALALAYVHIVTFSQLMLAALMGILRSRRFRDLAIVVFTLAGAGCSIGSQLASRVLIQTYPTQLLQVPFEHYLQWLPVGMSARAITLADGGQYVAALPWLAGSLVLIPPLLWLWARVLEHGITTAETATAPSGRRGRRAARALAAASVANASVAATQRALPQTAPRRELLPAPVQTIAAKDLRYLWRDPQLKAALLSALVPLLFVLLPSFYGNPNRLAGQGLGSFQVLLAPLPMLFIVLSFSINALGLERQGLQTLFLFPIKPRHVLFAKNLVIGGLAVVLQVLSVVALSAISGGWSNAPAALAVGVAADLVMLGCGNVTSVLLPFRVRQMHTGANTISSENGCLRSLLMQVVLLATALLLVPVGAALVLPLLFERAVLLAVTLPLSLVYGLGLYLLATWLIAPQLLTRAPEILAITTREN